MLIVNFYLLTFICFGKARDECDKSEDVQDRDYIVFSPRDLGPDSETYFNEHSIFMGTSVPVCV